MVADGTAAMGLAFFYEMDRRIRDMQARGIQPCDPSADVYTPAGLKALEHWRALCAHLQALNHVTVENAALRARVAEAAEILRWSRHYTIELRPKIDAWFERVNERATESAGEGRG